MDIISKNHFSKVELTFKAITAIGKRTDLESVRKRKDGSLVPVHIFGVPFSIEEKQKGQYWMYLDITDRKQAEETLRESEERFRSIFMNSTIGIYRTSLDGDVLMANPMLVEMLGYKSFEELQKRDLSKNYSPEYQRSDFIQRIEKEGIIKGMESSWNRADNSILYVRESARAFRDSEGRILYFEGMVEDITERKHKELEIQIQSEIGHSVSTSSNLTELMQMIHSSLRKVVYAENCFFALYDENTGLFSFPYYVDQFDTSPQPLELAKSYTSYVFHSGKSLIIATQVFQQLKDQKKIELIGSVAPSLIGVVLQISSRIIGVLVLQHYQEENIYKEEHLRFLDSIASQIANVIERRRAKEDLEKSEANLRESNATKDKFFSIISHDLKSPFNAIVGFSDILVEQVREKNLEGIEEYAKIIQDSSQRAMDLLMNLMEWSRSQTGRMEFSPQYLDIDVLINDATELLSDVAHQKLIAISRELPQNIRVFADKAMIGTLLRNLISNAIKFTYPGGSIVVSAEQKQDELKVTISDNGIGINADAMGKLFRIEESYSTKGTQNEQGTGLGLILCKEFIEKHGGKIWAESEVGKGSKFSFTIPKV
ncbi:MAG: ATP-binding protein [Bacteroidota bacterium]